MAKAGELKIVLEFGGGAELLFDNIKKREVTLPDLGAWLPQAGIPGHAEDTEWKMKHLLVWLSKEVIKDKNREHLFLVNGELRAGILVLVNDQDWELVGQQDYALQHRDNVLFISTLHGG